LCHPSFLNERKWTIYVRGRFYCNQ
jgi:hypothetical protein